MRKSLSHINKVVCCLKFDASSRMNESRTNRGAQEDSATLRLPINGAGPYCRTTHLIVRATECNWDGCNGTHVTKKKVRKFKSSTSYKELLNIAKFLKEPNTHRTTNGNVNNVGPIALRPSSLFERRTHTYELSLKKI